MSVMETFFPKEPTTPEARMAQELANRGVGAYATWRLFDRLTDMGLDHVSGGNARRRREDQLRELEIAHKRRALGLPYEDDDYERAVNDDLSFSQKGAVAAFGREISAVAPNPSFLEPTTASKWFKMPGGSQTTQALGHALGAGLQAGGGRNVRFLGSVIDRIFR